MVQAELLARSITDAARFEGKRIVARALETDDHRSGLVRQAERLNGEALEDLPPFGTTADALAAEIRAAASERVRAIRAQAEAEGARVKASIDEGTLELVTRAERRVARLERRHHRFRKQLNAPFVKRRVTASTGAALIVIAAAALVVFVPGVGDKDRLASALPDAIAAPESAPPVACPIPSRYQATFRNAARAANVPPGLLAAVAEAESHFNPAAKSGAGAQGMLQLMPATARMLQANPLNTRQNIRGGARYLRYLRDQFGGYEAALAAYHAGPSALTNRSFGAGTQRYVDGILNRRAAFETCG